MHEGASGGRLHATEMLTPVVDRLLADSVLLRHLGDLRLVRLAQRRDHLLFSESALLHDFHISVGSHFSVSVGPNSPGKATKSGYTVMRSGSRFDSGSTSLRISAGIAHFMKLQCSRVAGYSGPAEFVCLSMQFAS